MRSFQMFSSLLLAAALLTGCNTTETNEAAAEQEPVETGAQAPMAKSGPVNANCPIMGGEVDPDVATVSFNGHEVGFCCGGCDDKFEAWSDAQKQEFVAAALANQ